MSPYGETMVIEAFGYVLGGIAEWLVETPFDMKMNEVLEPTLDVGPAVACMDLKVMKQLVVESFQLKGVTLVAATNLAKNQGQGFVVIVEIEGFVRVEVWFSTVRNGNAG
ncbi:MAG: hypothetical protein SGARI_000347 [Bacillariaceae sp.]